MTLFSQRTTFLGFARGNEFAFMSLTRSGALECVADHGDIQTVLQIDPDGRWSDISEDLARQWHTQMIARGCNFIDDPDVEGGDHVPDFVREYLDHDEIYRGHQ